MSKAGKQYTPDVCDWQEASEYSSDTQFVHPFFSISILLYIVIAGTWLQKFVPLMYSMFCNDNKLLLLNYYYKYIQRQYVISGVATVFGMNQLSGWFNDSLKIAVTCFSPKRIHVLDELVKLMIQWLTYKGSHLLPPTGESM